MSIVRKPLIGDVSWTPGNLERRRVTFGLVTSVLTIGLNRSVPAHAFDIPYFRSGRFQFTILQPRQIIPSIRLFALKGGTIDLASLRGQPILLNFWASWCEACRMEMPVLDRLQSANRRSGLQIIAVSEDRGGRAVVVRFVNQLKISNLNIYLDPNGYVAFNDVGNRRHAPFALYGMPITYAIAASGWIVGYMPGAADWNSSAAGDLIDFLRRS
jgi:thiol-disulfide isomerase/thioredoxin